MFECHRDPKAGRPCSWEKWGYAQRVNPELTTATDTESPLEYVSVPLAHGICSQRRSAGPDGQWRRSPKPPRRPAENEVTEEG